jgi:hypothetical protein
MDNKTEVDRALLSGESLKEPVAERHGPGDGTGLDAEIIPLAGVGERAEQEVRKLIEVGSSNWLNEVFSHHAPDTLQIESYEQIRAGARNFAGLILTCVPPCADRSAAIRKVREAVMTANAAIALRGLV